MSRNASVFLLLLALLALPARAGDGLWTSLGPYGADIAALAVDPTDPDVVYAGTVSAGLFKSIDGGTTWTFSGRGLGRATITSVAVDPREPSTMYVAQTGIGASRSIDGGATWTLPRPGTPLAYDLVVDPRRPRTLYAAAAAVGGGGGVLRSTDGGDTWSRVGRSFRRAVHALALDAGSGTLYAATHFDGVFWSSDQGSTWQRSAGFPQNIGIYSLAIAPDSPRTLLAGTAGGGIYRSTNRGRNWRLASFPAEAYVVAFQSGGRAYAGTLDQGLLRSIDGGATWQPAGEGIPDDSQVLAVATGPGMVYAGTSFSALPGVYRGDFFGDAWYPAMNGLTGLWVEAAAVDPVDPHTLYVAAGRGLFKSTDGGAHWTLIQTLLDPPGRPRMVSDILIDPARPAVVYVTFHTEGAMLRSLDAGATWERVGGSPVVSLQSLAVDPRAPGHLWGAGWFGLFHSTDTNAPWRQVDLDTPQSFIFEDIQVDPRNPAVVWVAGGLASVPRPDAVRVFRSGDGGTTWERRDTGIATSPVTDLVLHPADPDTLWAVTPAALYRSTDAGRSWSRLPRTGPSRIFTALAVSPAGILYAAGQDGTVPFVLRSADGGLTWSPLRRGLGAKVPLRLLIDPHDPAHLYAGASSGGLIEYTDR